MQVIYDKVLGKTLGTLSQLIVDHFEVYSEKELQKVRKLHKLMQKIEAISGIFSNSSHILPICEIIKQKAKGHVIGASLKGNDPGSTPNKYGPDEGVRS